jgi:serine/threonine protein kinase
VTLRFACTAINPRSITADSTFDFPHRPLQILEAIYCLHGCNLLHRDLKTLNVLLVKGKDGQMEARVADPGLCKYLENLNVAARTPNMGTWGSQAPESLRYGHEQGTGVDVWAIGIIWWELLVGTHPWPQVSGGMVMTGYHCWQL